MTKRRSKRAVRRQRLTELTVKKAKPQPGRYFLIWDALQRGLALKIEPTGAKSFLCVYSRHGRARWLRLGNADSVDLEKARLLAGKTLVAVAEGHDPAADKKAERTAGTFADLHERYLNEHAEKHNKSWPQAAALVRHHVLPRWGKLQATSITRGDVKAMMARIEAPIAANQTLAAVSAIFTWGTKEEIVGANPCKLVARNPVKSRERVLAESELPLFWAALEAVDPIEGAALKAILLTGQRPGEVAHMRREHVVDGWWQMPGEPLPTLGWPGTKNKQTHRVWLPQAAQELIGDGDTGFVFAGARGGPTSGLDRAMRAVSTKLGGEPVRPHDLRRTHGSTITALGFGRDAMNRIQNHKEGGIADVYDRHHYERESKRIMEAVASRIMALVEEGAESENVLRPEFGGR